MPAIDVVRLNQFMVSSLTWAVAILRPFFTDRHSVTSLACGFPSRPSPRLTPRSFSRLPILLTARSSIRPCLNFATGKGVSCFAKQKPQDIPTSNLGLLPPSLSVRAVNTELARSNTRSLCGERDGHYGVNLRSEYLSIRHSIAYTACRSWTKQNSLNR
jgi:hypothetical protein